MRRSRRIAENVLELALGKQFIRKKDEVSMQILSPIQPGAWNHNDVLKVSIQGFVQAQSTAVKLSTPLVGRVAKMTMFFRGLVFCNSVWRAATMKSESPERGQLLLPMM